MLFVPIALKDLFHHGRRSQCFAFILSSANVTIGLTVGGLYGLLGFILRIKGCSTELLLGATVADALSLDVLANIC